LRGGSSRLTTGSIVTQSTGVRKKGVFRADELDCGVALLVGARQSGFHTA